MSQWWLLHGVGDADLGVSSDRQNTERDRQREQRQRALHETTDPVVLRDLLLRLRWDGPTTSGLSPLAAATRALPPGDPVRLVLVATENTQSTADALVAALNRVPGTFNRESVLTVAQVEGTDASGGLPEDEVAAALAPHLQEADESDRVLITWGSGSTQLALGSVEAAIRARLRWLFANVGSPPPAQPYVLLDPGQGLDVDPLVPLLRRWRYHDRLAHLVESGEVSVSDELRQAVLADGEHWREAHRHPTAQNLRWLMTDALMRGDATSYFAVRAYVLAQYQQLREREEPPSLDLVAWAARKNSKMQLGDMLKLIREERTDREVTCSKNSTSGQWLTSKTVRILNTAGIRASHQLAPPAATLRRSLREHLATLATVPAAQSPVPEQAALLPAMAAWYIAVVGEDATQPGSRDHPMQAVAAKGVDQEVASYLGFTCAEDVDRQYLVLGTPQGSVANAAELACRVNELSASEVAVAGTVPAPTATPPFDTDAAHALLRDHFQRVRTDVGALVLVPTGPKPLVLSLMMAGLRLAAEQGVPLFLRQMVGPRAMHLLPVRFGADYQLLGLARHALDILELDVAVRLLGSCSAGHELAARTDHLRRALRCDDPDHGANWPAELPRTWSRQDRSTGLVAQRVEIWADLAETHREPAHGVRAVMGAYAVLERSIRAAQPQQPREKNPGGQAWQSFTRQMRGHARRGDSRAQALCALLQVRNDQPISHGVGAAQNLDVMITRELRSPRPVAVAELLRLVADALRPRFDDVFAGTGTPSLSALLDQLRADVRKAQDSELARLARTQAATQRTQADLIDLLGAAAVEAVATPEPEE
jgi:hypothetical protein